MPNTHDGDGETFRLWPFADQRISEPCGEYSIQKKSYIVAFITFEFWTLLLCLGIFFINMRNLFLFPVRSFHDFFKSKIHSFMYASHTKYVIMLYLVEQNMLLF